MQPPEIVAAYPNPPPFYKLYANYKPNGDYGPDEKQPPPPPPPPEGTYKMFGLTYTTSDILPSLEDEGRKQLYPKDITDPIPTLKKLNRSLLFNYLQLLEGLVSFNNPKDGLPSDMHTSSEKYKTKIEDIELLFINIHHLLNSYRPHQAREFLIETMEQQIAQKRKATTEILSTVAEARRILETTRKSLPVTTLNTKQTTDDKEMTHNNQDESLHFVLPPKLAKMKSILDDIKSK